MTDAERMQDAIEELNSQIVRLKASMNKEGNGVKLHRLRVITWLRDECRAELNAISKREHSA